MAHGWAEEKQLGQRRARVLARTRPSEVTVEVWLTAYQWLLPSQASERTLEHRAQMVRQFRLEHGALRMVDVTALHAQAWALEHRSQVRFLRDAWKRAVLLLSTPERPLMNIWRVVELPARTKERRRAPTSSELNSILGACARWRDPWAPHFTDLVTVAAYTGAREGGLIGLRRGDVDLERGLVRLVEKGDRERQAVVPVAARGAFERALAWRAPVCDCLIGGARGAYCLQCGRVRPLVVREERAAVDGRVFVFRGRRGAPLSGWVVQTAWKRVRGEFPHGFHSLRHYAATWLASQGVDPLDIAVQLGHTTLEGKPYVRLVERTYDHHFDTAAALERIAGAL